MAERPILFSGPMVRAILEGRKTVTRHLIAPTTAFFGSAHGLYWKHANFDQAWVDGTGSPQEYLHLPCHRGDERYLADLDERWRSRGHSYREAYPDCGACEVCNKWGWRMTSHRLWSRVRPGDHLWVRETYTLESCHEIGWYEPPFSDGRPLKVHQTDGDGTWWVQPHYKATDPEPELSIPGRDDPGCIWRPSIFMPRWASRLTLEVVSVRAERLQDITTEDVRREGLAPDDPTEGWVWGADQSDDPEALSLDIVEPGAITWREAAHRPPIEFGASRPPGPGWYLVRFTPDDHERRVWLAHTDEPARERFALLWDRINGKRAPWESNPWVWVVEFRRLEVPAHG